MKNFKFISVIFVCTLVFMNIFTVRAEYMLPYPSYMPGNKLYVVSKIMEQIESLWYWGAIGQTKYHMMLSDKYLVEAKTLFEYTQYPLAINALNLSDEHIGQVPKYIAMGKSRGVDMVQFESLFAEERKVQRAVLEKLKAQLPKTFTWTPEKEAPTTLNIEELLLRSMTLRL